MRKEAEKGLSARSVLQGAGARLAAVSRVPAPASPSPGSAPLTHRVTSKTLLSPSDSFLEWYCPLRVSLPKICTLPTTV